MFDSLSISKRIKFGFAIVSVVVLAISGTAYFSANLIGQSYSQYRETAADTIALDSLLAEANRVQSSAIRYRNEKTPELRREVQRSTSVLVEEIEALGANIIDPERSAQLDLAKTSALSFEASFLELASTYDRIRALRNVLRDQTSAALDELGLVSEIASRSQDLVLLYEDAKTQQALLQSLILVERYILTEDVSNYEAIQGELAVVSDHFDQMNAMWLDAEPKKMIGSAFAIFENMIATMAETHQALQFAAELRTGRLDALGTELDGNLRAITEEIRTKQQEIGPRGQAILDFMAWMIPAAAVTAFLLALVTALVVSRWITVPIQRLVTTTTALAGGNTEVDITGHEHNHELGKLAQALVIFRKAHIERDALVARKAEEAKAQQANVVEALSKGLGGLANGKLSLQIREAFPEEYETLRRDFNSALEKLKDTIMAVASASVEIEGNTKTISESASELQNRTENQAATLEQTAAAIDELSKSVASAAEGAKEVETTVGRTLSEAEQSNEVVKQAVDAMDEIEESSNQISQISIVIDDIAFQTNLLALNAGVEAARAGEAGKGFAVVASEVRALAQRSSDAAKEVSALITQSSQSVEKGTSLVGRAGTALSEIIDRVNHISSLISVMASSSEEQARGLQEINIGVSQLDRATQQNATMVEKSNELGDSLASEAKSLSRLMKQFSTERVAEVATAVRQSQAAEIEVWGREEDTELVAVNGPASSASQFSQTVQVDDIDEQVAAFEDDLASDVASPGSGSDDTRAAFSEQVIEGDEPEESRKSDPENISGFEEFLESTPSPEAVAPNPDDLEVDGLSESREPSHEELVAPRTKGEENFKPVPQPIGQTGIWQDF